MPKSSSNKSNDKLATINRLSSPILAKLPKEVKNIAKFFKKNKKTKERKTQKNLMLKHYHQIITLGKS